MSTTEQNRLRELGRLMDGISQHMTWAESEDPGSSLRSLGALRELVHQWTTVRQLGMRDLRELLDGGAKDGGDL